MMATRLRFMSISLTQHIAIPRAAARRSESASDLPFFLSCRYHFPPAATEHHASATSAGCATTQPEAARLTMLAQPPCRAPDARHCAAPLPRSNSGFRDRQQGLARGGRADEQAAGYMPYFAAAFYRRRLSPERRLFAEAAPVANFSQRVRHHGQCSGARLSTRSSALTQFYRCIEAFSNLLLSLQIARCQRHASDALALRASIFHALIKGKLPRRTARRFISPPPRDSL